MSTGTPWPVESWRVTVTVERLDMMTSGGTPLTMDSVTAQGWEQTGAPYALVDEVAAKAALMVGKALNSRA